MPTTDSEGAVHPDHAAVGRAPLHVDVRKWVLNKMLPKVYGDRLPSEIKSAKANTEEMSANELAREVAYALTLVTRHQVDHLEDKQSHLPLDGIVRPTFCRVRTNYG